MRDSIRAVDSDKKAAVLRKLTAAPSYQQLARHLIESHHGDITFESVRTHPDTDVYFITGDVVSHRSDISGLVACYVGPREIYCVASLHHELDGELLAYEFVRGEPDTVDITFTLPDS